MKITESTWSPFQSSDVRDICAHLTDDEKQQLMSQAGNYGRSAGGWIGLPLGVVVASFFYSATVGCILAGLFVICLVVLVRRRVQTQQQRVREMLCETKYARERGYRPETLKIYDFPWSHK
jgi:hypothetical protein